MMVKCRLTRECVSQSRAVLISLYRASESKSRIQSRAGRGSAAINLGAFLDDLEVSKSGSASSRDDLWPQKVRPSAAAHRSNDVMQVPVAITAMAANNLMRHLVVLVNVREIVQ